jgi:hypothetical protein
MASKKNEALAVPGSNTGDTLARASAAELALDPLAAVLQEGDVIEETGTEELVGTARIPRFAFNLSTITDENGVAKPVLKTVFVQTVSGQVKEKLSLQVITVHVSREWKERVDGKSVRRCSSWDARIGRMENGEERPCAGCPDYAWAKDANGKNKRNCGDVQNVVCADLETSDVAILAVKKTALRPWRDYYSKHFAKQRSVRDPKTGMMRRVDLPFFARETIVTLRLVTKNSESWAEPVFQVGPVLSREHVLTGAQMVRDYRETFLQAASVIDHVAESADEGGGAGDSSFDFGENREAAAESAAPGMR